MVGTVQKLDLWSDLGSNLRYVILGTLGINIFHIIEHQLFKNIELSRKHWGGRDKIWIKKIIFELEKLGTLYQLGWPPPSPPGGWDSNIQKLFPKIHNPDFNTYCILDPIFQYYSSALKEFISRSPRAVTTINATEGGSIFGPRIKSMKFNEFLSEY